ncbi:MAG: TonB-dependent receptor [Candidatus Omnitrophica bacterium]|nr:TonB-dependent receptor [Candidatus Omnitrophota bacterium]
MFLLFFLCFLLAGSPAFADTGTGSAVPTMEEVVVKAKEEKGVQFLPDVRGAKIYSGKKTSVMDLNEAPTIINNNYRQTLVKTPGLLISEESTPLVSIGYRGLNPDRAQYMQVLKDGIPIQADLFGYPEAYYTPPLQLVDDIEFVRGGSALLYGPQPGGAINYVTKDPYEGPFSVFTENVLGSHDFYSTYTGLSGTQGSLGHTSYLHHRQSQGFRDFNSQFDVSGGGSKIVIEQDPTAHWTVAFDLYEETHGEPGGLTRADFDTNSSLSTRLMDHFELNRYYGSLAYEKEVSENTFYEWKLFGGTYDRLSWRQRGGGFGTIATGANAGTNDIQIQEFGTIGTDLRMRKDSLTAGLFYYHSDSPRIEKRGTAGDAEDGAVRKDSDREMNYLSLFVENTFRRGKLSVTPGIRLENIWQGIRENINLDKTAVGLADESDFDLVPLLGVGVDYDLTPAVEAYGNLSQSYRPKVYADAVPLGTNQVVAGDLQEGDGWQAEAGLRGKLFSRLSWDASIFYMRFTDQTGTVGNTIQNVGDAEYPGAELALEYQMGSVNLFYNATVLAAEFTGGPNTGKTPQYAPDYLMRAGVEYDHEGRAKVRLGSTFVDGHFGDDSNLDQRLVPSYKVWDLTAEMKLHKDNVAIFGGINNLFDERYFSRVTAGGIDPADGRNYYGGVKCSW